MDNTIYIILIALGLIFIVLNGYNRKRTKARKSKKFMEGYRRKDKKNEKQ